MAKPTAVSAIVPSAPFSNLVHDRTQVTTWWLASVCVWVFVFPAGSYGYVGSYLNILVVIGVLGFFCRLRVSAIWLLATAVLLIEALIELFADGPTWAMREFARTITLGILLLRLPHIDLNVFFRAILWLLGLIILVDFIFLYLKVLPDLGMALRNFVYFPGVRPYIKHFWRHVGILGNSNASAFLYGLYLVLYTHSWTLRGSQALSLSSVFHGVIAVITIVLLFASYSRSALIGAALTLGLGFAISSRRRVLYVLVVCLAVITVLQVKMLDRIVARFSYFSSGEARLTLWAELIGNMSISDVIVGRPFESRYIDSDYVYFFVRYGMLGLIVNLTIIVHYFRVALRVGDAGHALLQLFFYASVCGLTMGIFSTPSTAAFLFLLGQVVAAHMVAKSSGSVSMAGLMNNRPSADAHAP